MLLQVLYFDLGNVLLSFSHEVMCRQMAEVTGVSPQVVSKALFGSVEARAAQWLYESGQLSTDEYFDYFCRVTGTRPDREQLRLAVCDIFAPIESTWELARQLAAAGHRLAILSNTNPVQWEYVTDGRFALLKSIGQRGCPFAGSILSYEVQAMKPDRAIYDAAIERAGIAANEIFFVDDRPENVAGAVEAGLDAVVYEGTEKLADDLRDRGVKLPPSAC
jgi:putative hydrolase of the HAD superfamily